MKYISLIVFLFLLFPFQACKSQQELPASLYNKWMRVHEEDSAGYWAFLPPDSDRKLPPSHGREVYEFKPDNTFVLHTYGPADRPITYEGNWKKVGEDKIKVQFKQEEVDDFSLQIISHSPERLLVKKE